MGNNVSIKLRTQTTSTIKKQMKAGKKLRDVSRLVREEQQKFHAAKIASSSVGAVGGAMMLTALLAVPFTSGSSLGLMAAGATTGIIGGAGDLATSYIESKTVGPRIEETQKILDEILEHTLKLVEITNRKLSESKEAIDFENCVKNNMKIVSHKNYGRKVGRAIAVINCTLEAIRLSKGIPPQQFAICDISDLSKLKGPSVDKVIRGVTVLKAVKTAKTARSAGKLAQSAGKVAKTAGGVALTGLGVVWDIKSIIDNSFKIANNESDNADLIEKIAGLLSRSNEK